MLEQSVTLADAKTLIRCMAKEQSLLLLSSPGVGKSDLVRQAATEAGLECRSLLGTQIAPEDVSGVPRIVGERSVFCPPRVLLPEDGKPFCLFLDELPAAAPDIQKAFYSLLLERRIGEFPLPEGTWVVAAGNRSQDRALVRAMSSALVNRVLVLNVRVDQREWMIWAKENGVRDDILAFIAYLPNALQDEIPDTPRPFSTPRSWVQLSRALDLVEAQGELTPELRHALAHGAVSASHAEVFCAVAMHHVNLRPARHFVEDPGLIPDGPTERWFVLSLIREAAANDELVSVDPETINTFLAALEPEHAFALLVSQVEVWGRLGADEALRELFREVTGL